MLTTSLIIQHERPSRRETGCVNIHYRWLQRSYEVMSSVWVALSNDFLSHTHRHRWRSHPSHDSSSEMKTFNTSMKVGAGGLPNHRLHPLLWGSWARLSVPACSFSNKLSFGRQFPFTFYVFSGLLDPWVFWGKHSPYVSDLLTLDLPEVSFVKSISRLGNLFSLFLKAFYPGSSHSKGSRDAKQLLRYNWGQKTPSAFVTWAFLGKGEPRSSVIEVIALVAHFTFHVWTRSLKTNISLQNTVCELLVFWLN